MAAICRHFIVSGKVQGVFFRHNTRKKAEELHLTGWVKNLNNGCVEVLACGDESKINLLADWLWQGPQFAKVESVIEDECPKQEFDGFTVA